MAIKNYTSTVSPLVSLGEIQAALAAHGAKKIMTEHDEKGFPTSVAFLVDTPAGPRSFLIEANISGVLRTFKKQKIKEDHDQAARTGWRNVRDWVLAQIAIIEAGMATMDEVFLPYLTDRNGSTVYKLYSSGGLMLGDGTV